MTHAKTGKSVPSKDLAPLPSNFTPVFIRNQFFTTIPLPTKSMYPNASGQRAIVTGANTGLGFEAARQLLALGYSHLVLGVRSLDKGREAAKTLQAANPRATIDVWELDMASYPSVRAFARRCQEQLPGRIDSTILNAGLSHLVRVTSATGHETTMQVNHYGTALLALLLIPVIKAKATATASGPSPTRPPAMTIVNSVTGHLCKFPNRAARPLLPTFDDDALLPFDATERYGVSKLISQMFLVELTDRIAPVHGNPFINFVDPGLTKGTSLFRHAKGAMRVAVKGFFSAAGRTVERGAATYVHAVLGKGPESHGCFLMNAEIAPLAGYYYTEKGLSALVWEETLKELEFADAEDIVRSVQL
ncbi:short-chain dehydrogenase/reductase family protein [Sporothrix schenckii 1099-18]|uniref:Short-chain dehydrogenase/reductase family protein n=2 Tax=Sporothrix schenckii TaxID=29908 RepID=U7Q3M5_SPOS1|nr:short-chain dehydrogenase/reductase family protein [Sporothrix schenckii 1099-18]ERT02474.1 hypothetical protein HMPREF1624_00773 [Sporothrix schenckii ATCC 58251]KJR80249.1 short-chain dehydrogenase/reductase family protein [Sporothrix schenckii 1099-18]